MRYISDDGKVFNTEEDCCKYENRIRIEREEELKKKEKLKMEQQNRLDEINKKYEELQNLVVEYRKDYGVCLESYYHSPFLDWLKIHML